MGPRASPRKRSNDDEGGTGTVVNKKRRRKLKHELLEEGWGELPTNQGADSGEPPTPLLQALLVMEQEKSEEEQLTMPR